MYWLAHVFGIDTQHSGWYDFWSGSATQLSVIGGMAAFIRHRNCHQRRCWRIGRHVVDGTPYCDRHHGAARGGSDGN